MRKLLWIGDAGVSTGFARCTHKILDTVRHTWDVSVLGINYLGDPHLYDYPIYPCYTRENMRDWSGIERIPKLVKHIRPDLIVVLNDPWNIPRYVEACGNVPVVGFLAVDGKNCRGRLLNDLRLAIFWTEFGLKEAQLGGYTGHAAIIPLGVDLDVYRPIPRLDARARLPFGDADLDRLRDAFIVGVVNRNQPRKRLDLTLQYFAEWIREQKINDAYLFMHVAPTGDDAYDLSQLAEYYGINNKLVLIEPEIGFGVSDSRLVTTYNAFDVLLSTSQGEGWSLPTMEAMACGVPCIAGDWAALGEWPGDAILKVPCHGTIATPALINSIGGIPDRKACISALNHLYQSPARRKYYADAGLSCVSDPKYRWRVIGERFTDAMNAAVDLPVQREEQLA